jgi:hypothetical protein
MRSRSAIQLRVIVVSARTRSANRTLETETETAQFLILETGQFLILATRISTWVWTPQARPSMLISLADNFGPKTARSTMTP